jgi:hypothetical protein
MEAKSGDFAIGKSVVVLMTGTLDYFMSTAGQDPKETTQFETPQVA